MASSRKKKRARVYDLAFPVFRALIGLVRRMPRRVALAFGARCGDIAYYILPQRRRVAHRNLDIAYGESMSRGDRYRIVRRSFRNIGMDTVEFLRWDDLDAEYFRRHVEIQGLEHVRAAFARGQGVVAISAHLGHFQLIAAALNKLGIGRCLVVGRTIKASRFDAEIRRLREAAGIWSLPPKNAILPIYLALRRNDAVGIVMDQNIGWARAVFVDFFGKPAATTPGAAIVAGRRETTVLGCFAVRLKDLSHRIVFTEPIPYVRLDDPDETVLENTRRYTCLIEAWVRRHPDQWFWLHRRWRTRPQEEWGTPNPYD